MQPVLTALKADTVQKPTMVMGVGTEYCHIMKNVKAQVAMLVLTAPKMVTALLHMTVIGATMVNWNTIHTVSQAIVTQHVLTALQMVTALLHMTVIGATMVNWNTIHTVSQAIVTQPVLTALKADTVLLHMTDMHATMDT
jgi:hypothetical protein